MTDVEIMIKTLKLAWIPKTFDPRNTKGENDSRLLRREV